MKSFQEKEKKFYDLLDKLNNFDVSQIQNNDKSEIEKLKEHKNQLEIEKNSLEQKFEALSQELNIAQKKIEELENNKKKDQIKQNEFNQKIDELNQETEYLIEEIDKWQM
tara:strand:- start:3072 stop:3401 length:330 start_codon:yes stop_codon:yes gene_type:complete